MSWLAFAASNNGSHCKHHRGWARSKLCDGIFFPCYREMFSRKPGLHVNALTQAKLLRLVTKLARRAELQLIVARLLICGASASCRLATSISYFMPSAERSMASGGFIISLSPNFGDNSTNCSLLTLHQLILFPAPFLHSRFKYAVYKNLGHFETIDQIRAGR